jgi:hypothetical protein
VEIQARILYPGVSVCPDCISNRLASMQSLMTTSLQYDKNLSTITHKLQLHFFRPRRSNRMGEIVRQEPGMIKRRLRKLSMSYRNAK